MSRRRPLQLQWIRHVPAPSRGRARGLLPAILIAILLAFAALPGSAGTAMADDRPSLKVDPASVSVQPGQEFTLKVYQITAVDTTGAQVSISYDPALLQLKDFALGSRYTCANAVFAFGNADLGTSGNKDLAIGRANKFGTLENAAGFLLPGNGTLVAGSTVFLTLTFVARPEANGQANIGLLRGSLIDANGAPLDPHLLNGTVTVGTGSATGPSGSPVASAPSGASGSPSPSGSPARSPSNAAGASSAPSDSGGPQASDSSGCAGTQPSGGASGGPAPSVAPPVSPTTPVKLSVAPTSLTLKAGDTARIFLIANADGNISSVTADLTFDVNKLQVTEVLVGNAWSEATAIAVATDKSKRGVDGAMQEANATGVLQQVGAFFAPGVQALPFGEAVFVSVLVKAKTDTTTNLSIGNAAALGVSGETLTVEMDPASLTKPPDKGVQLDPTLVIPLVLLAIVVIAAVWIARSGRISVRTRRRWPYYASMLLGLIPVALFAGMVAMLVVNAAPVVSDPGIPALFGGTFLDTKGNVVTGFQILPPLWGTILITTIAVIVALPVSLALAVAAVDFPMGPIGRLVRPVIGVLSGVPPIVYAVSVPIFVTAIMIPKFAANMDFSAFQNGGPAAIGADPSTWPPADVPYSAGGFPWDLTSPNSTLLAGLIVGLFLIPFVTPLFVDALRNVPRAAREASLALGANRTYTLRRVVLPRALPAMAGASTLAILKAMGDAVIVVFAAGTAASLPNPPWDVLERATGIGAWGSNLIGSFDVLDATCSPQQCAVGYTSALLMLVVAGAAVLVLMFLQTRGRLSGGVLPMWVFSGRTQDRSKNG